METIEEKKNPGIWNKITLLKKDMAGMPQMEETNLLWSEVQIEESMKNLSEMHPRADRDMVNELGKIYSYYQSERSRYEGEDLAILDKAARKAFVNLGEDAVSYAAFHTDNLDLKAYLVRLMGQELTQEDLKAVKNIDTQNFIDQLEKQATHLLRQPSDYDLIYNEAFLGYNHEARGHEGWSKLEDYSKHSINWVKVGEALQSVFDESLGGSRENIKSKDIKEGNYIVTSTGELETGVQVSTAEALAHARKVFEKAVSIAPQLSHSYLESKNKFLFEHLGIDMGKIVAISEAYPEISGQERTVEVKSNIGLLGKITLDEEVQSVLNIENGKVGINGMDIEIGEGREILFSKHNGFREGVRMAVTNKVGHEQYSVFYHNVDSLTLVNGDNGLVVGIESTIHGKGTLLESEAGRVFLLAAATDLLPMKEKETDFALVKGSQVPEIISMENNKVIDLDLEKKQEPVKVVPFQNRARIENHQRNIRHSRGVNKAVQQTDMQL